MLKPQLTLLLLLFAATAWCQNFTFTPQNPRPGDLITFTYEPAGLLTGTTIPIECSYYQLKLAGPNKITTVNAEDLNLARKGNKYTGKLQLDTASCFVFFGFSADGTFDNNNNDGYYLMVSEGEKARRGAYYAQYNFYNYLGREAGLERNTDKAFEALQKEIWLYPEDRKDYIEDYLFLAVRNNKDQASTMVQKEIEAALKSGLRKEEDYNFVATLYNIGKLPEQTKFIEELKKEKFPNGMWQASDFMRKLYMEKEPEVFKTLIKEAEEKVKTDSAWKNIKSSLSNMKLRVLTLYKDKKEWDKLQQAIRELNPKMNDELSMTYNNIAWDMQGKGDNIPLAEELSRQATEYAKKQMLQPTVNKPAGLTSKQWKKSLRNQYAMYADTYAMVLYRMNEYKKGFPYAKAAALEIYQGNDAYNNNTYALLAEKVLPLKQYKPQLEDFVRNGKSTNDVKKVLQRAYVQQKGSEEGFNDYMALLEKEEHERKMKELRKAMLNNDAPSFTLLDLNGKQVSLGDLKGKTVVLDFWATWCGPCISSFPGMQMAITKYKDNPDVIFLFVDTWERAEDKKKNAADFFASKKLDFQVLMDDENKVVEQYKVDGIPTKFVIDKNGKIRFKSVGYSGNSDKLVEELSTMIELANEELKKGI